MGKIPRLTDSAEDRLFDDPLYEPTVEHLVDTINAEVDAALDLLERLQLEAGVLVALMVRINEQAEHPALQYWRQVKSGHH